MAEGGAEALRQQRLQARLQIANVDQQWRATQDINERQVLANQRDNLVALLEILEEDPARTQGQTPALGGGAAAHGGPIDTRSAHPRSGRPSQHTAPSYPQDNFTASTTNLTLATSPASGPRQSLYGEMLPCRTPAVSSYTPKHETIPNRASYQQMPQPPNNSLPAPTAARPQSPPLELPFDRPQTTIRKPKLDFQRFSMEEKYGPLVWYGEQVVELACCFCKGNTSWRNAQWMSFKGVLGLQKHIDYSHDEVHAQEKGKRDQKWTMKWCRRKVLSPEETEAVKAGTYEVEWSEGKSFPVDSSRERTEANQDDEGEEANV